MAGSTTRTERSQGPAPDRRRGAAADDLALLRAHEPIIRYTEGEHFFPTSVERYVRECDLWVGRSERDRELLAPRGTLDEATLATFEAPPGMSLFLRLVQEPLDPLALTRWLRRPDRPILRAPGRLARVGLFARLVDAGFDAALLLRGRVRGGTAAAASRKYESARLSDPRFVYHGRVVRSGDWIVLHYLWFYFMNDWRTSFQGANDHEADWEQAFVFLEETRSGPRPVWFAVAAHDRNGDDVRRRWDDPFLVREGDHPVIFAGAGSHAGYFERGEYLTAAPLPAARPLRRFLEGVRRFWRDTLRQEDPGDLASSLEGALSIPFIDYARGDGLAIGPGQRETWTPLLLSDEMPWVDGYRGLFGLDTYDRFAGERAPAGPKWTRAGTIRRTWHDPVGWAGLAKVAPPSRADDALRRRIAELEREARDLKDGETALVRDLPGLELSVRSLGASEPLGALREARRAELAAREGELATLRLKEAALLDEIAAARRELARVEAGDFGDARAHLTRDHRPVPPETTSYGQLVELWSAVSISVVLVVIVAATYFSLLSPIGSVLLGLGIYVGIESAFRRRLGTLMLRTTGLLAIVATGLLLFEYATLVVVAAIVGLAVFTLADNLREITRG
jgi:hypothetical protein